jgi:hypothetical protein
MECRGMKGGLVIGRCWGRGRGGEWVMVVHRRVVVGYAFDRLKGWIQSERLREIGRGGLSALSRQDLGARRGC